VASQQTTQEIWEQEGPFPTYNLDHRGPRNVPYEFTKAATWTIIDGVEGYYSRSLLEPEVEEGRHYPVEFNFERRCWVEVRSRDSTDFGRYWQAFRTAATDLGLDITQSEVELHHELLTPHNNPAPSTSSTRSNSPTSLATNPEVITVRESPLSRFPLALSPKTKRTRSYTSCGGTHVTSGVNTRQTPSNLTGIRTTEITAWQLDALSSRDRRGSGRRGLSRRSGRVDILDLHQGR
jgi:hypothetical protein